MNKLFFALFIFLSGILFVDNVVFAQKTTSKTPVKKTSIQKTKSKPTKGTITTNLSKEEFDEYKIKISRLVSFLEFALNVIGSDSSASEDKEVIINSSYLKFFIDSKVQIEDDLDESRKVVTFKSIQGYLHDVDYFFSDAEFELSVDEINSASNDKNQIYFIVGVTRFLKATNSDGDTIRNTKKRYIEINLGAKDKDLKIASIYSTKYDESSDLQLWWSNLSEDWKNIFKKDMGNTGDSINYGQLKRILSTENLDLSGNRSILNIDPVNKLSKLKTLNISNTSLTDLSPLRNLIFLEVLDCSNTGVTSLDKLKYTSELKELYIHHTSISNLEPVKIFQKLELIDFNHTQVTSLEPLGINLKLSNIQAYGNSIAIISGISNNKNLKLLNISETAISDLTPIASLYELTSLNISNTKVSDLTPLSNLKKLKELLINNTTISTLQPIKDLPELQKIYSDHTGISKQETKNFMAVKPTTLVISESDGLLQWWNNLGNEWKTIFQKYIVVKSTPTMEQLAGMANLLEIDISNNKEIKSLQPLNSISNLKILLMNNTTIESIAPLVENQQLEILELSGTGVKDLNLISSLPKLQRVNFDDNKFVNSIIESLKNQNPKCLFIYKTQDLNSWWAGVPNEWRTVFQKHLTMEILPTSIQLHQLIKLDSVGITNNNQIKDLEFLKEFENLRVLEFFNTSVNSLSHVSTFKNLKKLSFAKNPVKSIEPLASLSQLEYLDMENTGVDNLEFLKGLTNINVLKLASTPIDDLKYLDGMLNLKYLDFSSTSVSNLKPLEDLNNLKTLKCFNTKLSSKKIDKFKKTHPDCDIVYY